MYEVNACLDRPGPLDLTRGELFGDTPTFKDEIDNRPNSPIYNQGVSVSTKMACGRYGLRHATNVVNFHTGGPRTVDPKESRLEFVDEYKTIDYDPIVEGSYLQDQLSFAKKKGEIAGYYKVTTFDQCCEAISNKRYIYTGSRDIDWKKTRDSQSKIAVPTSNGAGHAFEIDGYDTIGGIRRLHCRNSYGPSYMDRGYFYITPDTFGLLFSKYAIIDNQDLALLDRVRLALKKKKESMVYEVRNGILKWRPK